MSLYFGDGADGWANDGVAAVDLEWFKDDVARLRATLVHESYHAAQAAVRRARPVTPAEPPADGVLREALEALFAEGTATFVAPARAMPAAERAEAVRAGAALLDTVVTQLARARATGSGEALQGARDAISRGVSGAGPFYWLGAEMSAAIVAAHGPEALAATLPDGGPAFARAYLRAHARTAARVPGAPALLGPQAQRALAALPE